MPTTWRLVVEYDGRAFSGFQRQADARTVQQCLEEALSVFFGGVRVIVHGSGRTDAGVHALAQVVSFRVDVPRDPMRLRLGLNTMLPPELSVIEAAIVPPFFHARLSAIGKTYRYVILGRPDKSPFHVGRAWHIRHPIDWRAVEAGLAQLQGLHDFSGFRASSCTISKTVRNLTRAEHIVRGDEHHLEFDGPGFLRYQVRIMVGTVIDLGMGRRTPAQVQAALETGRREHAGRTAPPDGLYLVRVYYPPGAGVPWGEGSAGGPEAARATGPDAEASDPEAAAGESWGAGFTGAAEAPRPGEDED